MVPILGSTTASGILGSHIVPVNFSCKVVDRQEAIDRFNNDPDVFVFLLSTRAGALPPVVIFDSQLFLGYTMQ